MALRISFRLSTTCHYSILPEAKFFENLVINAPKKGSQAVSESILECYLPFLYTAGGENLKNRS